MTSELENQLNAFVADGDVESAWDVAEQLTEADPLRGWQARVRLCRLGGPNRLITARTLGHLAGALLDAGMPEEAAEAWADGAAIQDTHNSQEAASMWEAAGMALRFANEHKRACEMYGRALDSLKLPNDCTYRDARLGLAHCLLKTGDFDGAFTAAWWGLRLPRDQVGADDFCAAQAELWCALGYASVRLGRRSLAEYAFAAVAALTEQVDLVADAAAALRMLEENAAPTVEFAPSDLHFHVVWVGESDLMIARVDAGVFLLPDTGGQLGDVVADPR